MMIKKGEVLLRDVVFIMLIMSSVLIFASTFVTEMANNYDNSDMLSEYTLTNLSMSADNPGMLGSLDTSISNSSAQLQNTADEGTGLWTIITGAKDVVSTIIWTFLSAPYQLGGLIGQMIMDMGATEGIASLIQWTITLALWIVVIFAIITAFLQGAKI